MNDRLPQNVTSPANPSALPDSWIERLFEKMEDRFGDLWASRYGAFPRDRVKRTWAEDLADLTRDELARGVGLCRDRTFPPTLPEFRALCRPPMDFEAAYLEAVEQIKARESGDDKWSHPAVFFAAVAIGVFDLRSHSWQSIKARWCRVLGGELAKGEWPEVPAKREALPLAPESNADEARVRRGIDEAWEALQRKSKVDTFDYHAGWREIRRRWLAGEQLYSIQINNASEVLREVWENDRGVRTCRPIGQEAA